MWGILDGVSTSFRRPARRGMKLHIPAMILGAGVGIAAWEVVKHQVLQSSTTAAAFVPQVETSTES